MSKRTTKRRLLGILALIAVSTAAPAMAVPAAPDNSFRECVRHAMIDDNLWVFGAAGLAVAIGACQITSR